MIDGTLELSRSAVVFSDPLRQVTQIYERKGERFFGVTKYLQTEITTKGVVVNERYAQTTAGAYWEWQETAIADCMGRQ